MVAILAFQATTKPLMDSNSSRSLISASLLSVLHYTNDRYNPPRRIDLAQFKMNNSRGPSQAAAFYFSRSSPTSRGKSTLCAECLGINEQNTRFVPGTGKNTDRMAYPHYHTTYLRLARIRSNWLPALSTIFQWFPLERSGSDTVRDQHPYRQMRRALSYRRQ